jgi:putative endonuclease
MRYVYVIESVNFPNEIYIGLTNDLRSRFVAHNSGQSSHTKKFKPWRLAAYCAFSNSTTAAAFERYLKSGSGRAFIKKRLY